MVQVLKGATMIKALKLIDGDIFVAGSEFRNSVNISNIWWERDEKCYTVQLSNGEMLDVPITSVLFARRIPNEE